MTEHIDFSKLEPDESFDRRHLEECSRCRADWEAYGVVRGLARQAPSIEAPPFFAARVARLAVSEPSLAGPFVMALQRAAQRLLPVFATLVLAISAGVLWTQQQSSSQSAAWDVSAEEAQVFALMLEDSSQEPAEATVTDLFDLLAAQEGSDDDQSK
ncbi:MAG TPA: hypothetical protein VLV83_00895 [Acidobacteriota bacterium]|nr:hypothetical protein [Acidobacteriota bacterium]